MNVFEVVKENVTARQAAEAYGLKVGRTGMACCPFHSDKSPSMKLDERYYCFGCGATGDAVDLTAKLFGIGLREAAVKLAEDFGLNYDSRQKPSVRPRIREPTPEQKYQKEENHCYKVLTDYFHLLREWEKKYAPKQPDEEWNPLFAEALYKKNYIEYLLDILLYGSLEERKALVAEQRKEVLKLEQRIAELSADRTMHSRRNPKQLRAERGKVYNTAANYKRVLQYDPLLKGAIRKNLLTERIDIVKPLGWYRDSPTLTDVDVKYLLLYFEENYGLTVEKKIIDAVAVIANENRYHPVCDFLNALQWDGTERIRFCLHRFLGSDTDDYTYEALKLFLLGAISRAFKPGCKFEVMLCLVGGQGAGKSSFFRLLAVNDDWFSDDLKKLDDENVYRKMQGHWIIEMSEMIATANAKSIEEIKSFLSRQKETYKIPYETHPADRKRQCVFGGSSNTLDFLPLDRTGNRRFVPVMVYPERAEVHILADEQASREYINQMWAEAMEIYRSGNFRLRFSPAMNAYLKAHQKDFMPEDTKAGQILDYLERYSGSIVCSKQLYKEALGHDYDEPKQWELREINDIMNNAVTGWRAFSNPRYFPEPYRRQKGWERIRNDNEPDNSMDGFQEIPTEEMEQLGLPEEWLKQK